jgi:uncharacterized protein (TIGR00251 family)
MADSIISVRVTPRASRNEVAGFDGDVLRVRLKAPPVDGKANEALGRLLAEHLGVRLSDVVIVSGLKSRTKRVSINGVDVAAVRARLVRDYS